MNLARICFCSFLRFFVVNHHELKLNELIKFIFPVLANYYIDTKARTRPRPKQRVEESREERESVHVRIYALFKFLLVCYSLFIVTIVWACTITQLNYRSNNRTVLKFMRQFNSNMSMRRLIQFYVIQTKKKWPNTVRIYIIIKVDFFSPNSISPTISSQHK